MTTAADLINAALRKLKVIDIDTTADATQLANGLLALNAFVDGLNSEKATLFQEEALAAMTLTGATSYTIGSGGTFSVTRPERILSAYYSISGVDDGPLKIIEKGEWDRIAGKTDAGSPEVLWYDMSYTNARGVLHLWPNPASGSLYLTVASQLTEFAATSTTVLLPPGYRNMLIYNLAVEYSSEGGVLTEEIMRNASKYLGKVKRRNSQRVEEAQLEISRVVSSKSSNILNGP